MVVAARARRALTPLGVSAVKISHSTASQSSPIPSRVSSGRRRPRPPVVRSRQSYTGARSATRDEQASRGKVLRADVTSSIIERGAAGLIARDWTAIILCITILGIAVPA